MKYVSKFNVLGETIHIKDSDARNTAGSANTKAENAIELANVGVKSSAVATYAQLSRTAQQSADAQRGYSTCGVLWNENGCIIYDLGNDSANTPHVVTWLNSKAIHKVDALIVSHYHDDHITLNRLTNFVNGCRNSNIDISELTVYLPHKNINWASFIGTMGSAYQSVASSIKTYLSSQNIDFYEPVAEGESVAIGDFVVRFYNVDNNLYSSYYSYVLDETMVETSNTNYNNFSMCTMTNISKTNLWNGGDIEEPAEANMYKHVGGADVVIISHHGLNLRENQKYLHAMRASVSIVPVYGIRRLQAISTAVYPQVSRASTVGACFNNYEGEEVIVTLGAYGVRVLNVGGIPSRPSMLGEIIRGGFDLHSLTIADINRVLYTQNASQAAAVLNGPVVEGTKAGAGKYIVVPLNQNGGSFGILYISSFAATAPLMSYTLYDGDEQTWSAWKTVKFTVGESS